MFGVYFSADSLPRCQRMKSSGEDVELSCAVNFGGFWIPKIKWEIVHDDETAEDYPDGVSNRQFNSSNVTSSIIINASDTRKKDFRIRCTTFFAREEDDRLRVNATNIPDFNYTFTWSSAADNSSTPREKEGSKQQSSLSLISQCRSNHDCT